MNYLECPSGESFPPENLRLVPKVPKLILGAIVLRIHLATLAGNFRRIEPEMRLPYRRAWPRDAEIMTCDRLVLVLLRVQLRVLDTIRRE